MTVLAWCVSDRESGHVWNLDTGNGFLGGYQWQPTSDYYHGTYQSVLDLMLADFLAGKEGGVDTRGWTRNPVLASAAQQTAAFNYWSVRDPSAWPTTLPECGGV